MDLFARILVATDFSEPAQHATDLALALARRCEATLILFHTVAIPTAVGYAADVRWPVEELERGAKKSLHEVLAKLQKEYPRVEAVLGTGDPSEAILSTARERGADLLVMGTHGRRGLPRVFLGSVAERVVRLSPVPVLTLSGKSGAPAAH